MHPQIISPNKSIALFVKEILIYECHENYCINLPFYADGYPGLLFQRSGSDFIIRPHNKKMSPIFLYGQTIKPISIDTTGPLQIIVFQFYPFVLRSFWNISPESINDDCYDLDNNENTIFQQLARKLTTACSPENSIHLLTQVLASFFDSKKKNLDFSIRQAILSIIENRGQVTIRQIAEREALNIRTLERRFLKETGISAKQFAKIVQFQNALKQLNNKDFQKLTDIFYENGFADQSHFIRVFKAFTGKTPTFFNKI
ncbi:helix-turn-helix domain-containing protein [Sphingobacterium siyangense]|uniref:helix-turn-helix domain-containing protein n=1 Tax=Sphingobacterium siyangense TaxID=459529 RepID=UPI003DA43B2D